MSRLQSNHYWYKFAQLCTHIHLNLKFSKFTHVFHNAYAFFRHMINVICPHLSTHMNCFPVYPAEISCPKNPWLIALSKVNMQHIYWLKSSPNLIKHLATVPTGKKKYAEVSQKFCHIFVYASLWCVHQVTKTVQAMIGTCWGWLYCSSQCTALLCVWFESTDECAI